MIITLYSSRERRVNILYAKSKCHRDLIFCDPSSRLIFYPHPNSHYIMKKFLLLPLFAALALASCANNGDGEDGTDATDTLENAMQGAGNEMKQDIGAATDSVGAAANNAGNSVEATGEKMDGDSTVIAR
jgi:hypothetical protein